MAAGSEVPTHGPLNIGYGFSPSVYQPQSIAVPQGAGALWAGVGKTALDAGAAIQSAAQALQQSPVNPMVRAQQMAQKRASEEGIKSADWRNSLPNNFGQLFTTTDAAGNASTIAPGQIQDATTLANLQAAMKVGAGGGNTGHGEAPAVNKETARTGGDGSKSSTEGDESFEGKEYPAGSQPSGGQPAQQPKTLTPPTLEQQAHPGSVLRNTGDAVDSAGLMASTDDTGTGNYMLAPHGPDPAVERQSAADYRAQYAAQHPSGSIWSPGRPTPLAPPAPGPAPAQPTTPDMSQQLSQAAPAQPSTPGTVPGSLSDQFAQQQTQQWQNQNATQPLTADDAMKYMKTKTTLVQDATFLPHGGPNGAPAYAFHMKGGGVNTVPVSQMAQDGAGPTIAAQNTSMVLSASDRLKQQQQNALAAPPDQTQQAPPQAPPQTPPNISPPPPANLPQQPSISPPPPANLPTPPNISPPPPANLPQQPNISPPPPANLPPPAPTGPLPGQPPTPMPSGTGLAAPQGTPAPSTPPPAPGTPAALLAAARRPITDVVSGVPLSAYTATPSQGGPPVSQLSAQETGAGQPAQRDMWDVVPAAQQKEITSAAKAMGDTSGPYAGDRRVEGNTGPYNYYINDDPKSNSRGRVYTVEPPGPTDGYYNERRWYLGDREYRTIALPNADMKQHLKDYWSTQAGVLTPQEVDEIAAKGPEAMKPWLQRAYYNDKYANHAPTDAYSGDLDAAENIHKSYNRIGNMLQALDNHGYSHLSTKDRLNSLGGNVAQTAGLSSDAGGMNSRDAQIIRALDQEVAYAEAQAKAHPDLQLRTAESQGLDLQKATFPIAGSPVTLPNVAGSSPLQDIAFSGEPLQVRLDRLKSMQGMLNERYKDLIHQGSTQMMKVDPKHDANVIRISQGQNIEDKWDQYSGHSYPGDPPTVKGTDIAEFNRTHPAGTPFLPYGVHGSVVWRTKGVGK